MKPDFSTETVRQDAVTVVLLRGELDISNTDELHDVLAGVTGDLVVDCAELGFLDSTGISAFVADRRRRDEAGCTIRLVNIAPNIKRVLEVSGVLEDLT